MLEGGARCSTLVKVPLSSTAVSKSLTAAMSEQPGMMRGGAVGGRAALTQRTWLPWRPLLSALKLMTAGQG